jgi:hypothetical protein
MPTKIEDLSCGNHSECDHATNDEAAPINHWIT